MRTVTRRCRKVSRITITLIVLSIISSLVALNACQDASTPAQMPPTATPATFVLIPDLLTAQPAVDRSVTTIGYVLADQAGAILVDTIVFDPAGKPQLLDSGSPPIWLGDHAPAELQGLLRNAGDLEYASVVARAHLVGPGSFGPNGRYHYRLAEPTLQPLAAQETTIDSLLNQPAAYESRFIRMVGGLLIRETSALLVDKLGAGGIPEPKSRQIKLRGQINDRAMLARLKGAPGGAVHFGQIQIEGVWRNGALTPVSITIIT